MFPRVLEGIEDEELEVVNFDPASLREAQETIAVVLGRWLYGAR